MSSTEDEKERDLKALVCEKSPTGDWVVNIRKLAKVVEAEGFSFAVFDHVWERKSRVALFLTIPQMLEISPGKKINNPEFLLGCLVFCDENKKTYGLRIERDTTHWIVRKSLSGEMDICVVCYESADRSSDDLERTHFFCDCGTGMCFGCRLDLLSLTHTEMTSQCPNCRLEADPYTNITEIFDSIRNCFKGGLPFGEFSDGSLEIIEKITGIDLTQTRERALKQMNAIFVEYQSQKKVILGQSEIKDESSPELRKTLYECIRETVDRMRKKKVVSASAEDSSSAVAVRLKGGCANCGKQFWDKSDWKRAPKCAKCRRTAYCSAKCRKKHAKAHTAECSSAKVAKKKRKAKKKPKKGKCSSF